MKYPKCQDYADLPWSEWPVTRSKKDIQGTRAKYYFTEKQCINNHISLRMKSGGCLACMRARTKKWNGNEINKKDRKEYFKTRLNNPDALKRVKETRRKFRLTKKGARSYKKQRDSKCQFLANVRSRTKVEMNSDQINLPDYLLNALWANLQLKRVLLSS